MPTDQDRSKRIDTSRFEDEAERSSPGLIREFFDFLLQGKKWWLVPILVALLVLGTLVVLGGSSLAPFIYTVF